MLKVETASLVMSVQRSGTWVHPRLAVDLARWCSPLFAVWLDGWILDTLTQPPTRPPLEDRLYADQFVVRTELQLHEKVVHFIRKRYPNVMLVPGLGETGTTSDARLANWRKGYQAGCPDLLIVHRHPLFAGMAIEFKHPGGKGAASVLQGEFLEALEGHGWFILLSQSYDDIILSIADYMRDAVVVCPDCRRCFNSAHGLCHHVRKMHSKKRGRDEPGEVTQAMTSDDSSGALRSMPALSGNEQDMKLDNFQSSVRVTTA